MKKLIILSFLLTITLTGCSLSDFNLSKQEKAEKMPVIGLEEAKIKASSFINEYLVDESNQVTITNIKEVSGLYQLDLNLADGSSVTAYLSQDGKYFLSGGQEIAEVEKQAKQKAEQVANSKVEIEILEEGDGEETVGANSLVTVDYEGSFEDGTVFDSSYETGEPATFPLGQGQVIVGWEQGLIGMKVGEKRKIFIPSVLGYGEQGYGQIIPPNTNLIFEVKLIEFKNM